MPSPSWPSVFNPHAFGTSGVGASGAEIQDGTASECSLTYGLGDVKSRLLMYDHASLMDLLGESITEAPRVNPLL